MAGRSNGTALSLSHIPRNKLLAYERNFTRIKSSTDMLMQE